MHNIKEKPWLFGSRWAAKAFEDLSTDLSSWIIFGLCNFGIIVFLACIPCVGSIASGIAPLIISGVAMRLIQEKNQYQKIIHFDIVQKELGTNGKELFGLGVLSWGLGFIAIIPLFVVSLGLFSFKLIWIVQELMHNPNNIDMLFLDGNDSIGLIFGLFIGGICTLILLVGAFMATVFAPYLITIKEITSLDAMRYSFKAVQKNPWSMTSLSLWWLIYAIAGFLMCGLGLLVLTPIMQLSIYYAAEDIFNEDIE